MGVRTVRLSPQQREILAELAADGADNIEIADRLNTTADVVNTQLGRVKRATGCVSRTELAVKVARGIIRPE